MPEPKLAPTGPRTTTIPAVIYSQPCSPTPSTTASAPLLRTAKRSPARPAMKSSPLVAPYRTVFPARTSPRREAAGPAVMAIAPAAQALARHNRLLRRPDGNVTPGTRNAPKLCPATPRNSHSKLRERGRAGHERRRSSPLKSRADAAIGICDRETSGATGYFPVVAARTRESPALSLRIHRMSASEGEACSVAVSSKSLEDALRAARCGAADVATLPTIS